MILTFERDRDYVKMNQQSKYLQVKRSHGSKIIIQTHRELSLSLQVFEPTPDRLLSVVI